MCKGGGVLSMGVCAVVLGWACVSVCMCVCAPAGIALALPRG